MTVLWIAVAVAAGLFWAHPAVDFVLSVAARLRLRRDGGGDGSAGLLVYVEPTRAFGIRWGLRSLATGLRRAGYAGEVRYWRWQSAWRAWLMLPAVIGRPFLEKQARRLAEFLAEQRARGADRPIFLVGYSAGGFVAARALELLGADMQIDSAALLAPAIDPRRDLSPAAGSVRGRLVVVSSLLDYAGIGLGTLLAGTSDGRRTASMGMLGVRGRRPANVVEVRWRPGLIRLGHFGGHMSATAPGFVAERLAPAMGLGG